MTLAAALFALLATIAQPGGARRVISLDYCADLHVLSFVPPEEIVALSPQARSDYAYLRDAAAAYPAIRPEAEHILAAKVTTVVRSYAGDARMIRRLERAGVEVIDIGYPSSFGDIALNTNRLATVLGAVSDVRQPEPAAPRQQTALYLTPSGVTTGPGSLIDALLRAAGFENFETRPGWHDLPLERLASEKPDYIVTGFYDGRDSFEGWWGTMRHPFAEEFAKGLPRTDLPGALLACPSFTMFEAVEQLREAP